MIPSLLKERTEAAQPIYLYSGKTLQSVIPAETMFGYFVFSHLVPPFRPNHTLMLGYGGGTVAALMRKIWGNDCKITGVDIESQENNFVEYRKKIMDAKKFVWDATTPAFKDYLFQKDKYDYVCVDLWNGDNVCDFVFDIEFAVRLREMATGLVCTNVQSKDVPRLKNFNDYGYMFNRSVPCEGNQIVWWSIYQENMNGKEKA